MNRRFISKSNAIAVNCIKVFKYILPPFFGPVVCLLGLFFCFCFAPLGNLTFFFIFPWAMFSFFIVSLHNLHRAKNKHTGISHHSHFAILFNNTFSPHDHRDIGFLLKCNSPALLLRYPVISAPCRFGPLHVRPPARSPPCMFGHLHV